MENPEQAFVDYASSRNNGVGGSRPSSSNDKMRNFPSPKRVHFVNTLTIVLGIEKIEEEESETSKIKEKEESSDIRKDDKSSDIKDKACEHATNIGGEEEWMEYEQPLDLVDVHNESVYESLIEKMSSCSLNVDFRIEKGNPNNLKIPCMIWRKFIANAYIDLDLPMNVMSLAYYNSIRSQGYEHRGLNFVGIGMDMHVFV
ncbi:hypothetical protein Tco_0475353 [Tanacetum coccineum]